MKFVIVSGRSSHTVTAKNRKEAEQKFIRMFPYAQKRFIHEVPSGTQRMESHR